MSGASANAAARRRRGVSQQSSNNYTTQEKSNPKITTNNQSVPTLTVPQILMQLDKRISLIENKVNTPSESMLDINGNIDTYIMYYGPQGPNCDNSICEDNVSSSEPVPMKEPVKDPVKDPIKKLTGRKPERKQYV